jgi:hypothetical protein
MRNAIATMALAQMVGCAAPQMANHSPAAPSRALPPSVVAGGATGGDVPTDVSASAPATSPAPARRAAATARMVIKVARLELETRDPQRGFSRAIAIAKQLGGFTLNSRHEQRRSTVTVRVPAQRFEDAVEQLTRLGKVERREVTGTDVTAEFVDLTMRLANAESARRQYLGLLSRATHVSDAVAVQRELERVTGTIEQLKGRINLIQSQVSLSTIHLTLEKPTRPGPVGWIFYGLYHAIRWLFVWN